jgi:hypothetical protein
MSDYKPRQEVSSWHWTLSVSGTLLILLNLFIIVERMLS